MEKHGAGDSRRNISGSVACFSVCQGILQINDSGWLKSRFTMTDAIQQNNHFMRELSGSESGEDLPCREYAGEKLLLKEGRIFHGASGMSSRSPNCARISGVTPLVKMLCNIFTGLSDRSFAVRIMVIIEATFFWPRFVILPKVIFLNKTELRRFCSAKLFVGLIVSGYLRNTKSTFLNTISRLRILFVSWCDNGACWYNFLNLLRMSFLPERYFSGVKTEC